MSFTIFFWDSVEAACNISKYLNCVPHCINSKCLSAPHECFTKVTWRKHAYSRLLLPTLIYIEQSFWSYRLFDLGSYNQGVSYKKKRKGCPLMESFKSTALRTCGLKVWPPSLFNCLGPLSKTLRLPSLWDGGNLIWPLSNSPIFPGTSVLLTDSALAPQACFLFLKHSSYF